MAMSASSMWGRIEAAIAAIAPYQGSNAASANAYRNQVGIAMCQGIIEEIIADAVVTVPGITPGTSTATGTVSS